MTKKDVVFSYEPFEPYIYAQLLSGHWVVHYPTFFELVFLPEHSWLPSLETELLQNTNQEFPSWWPENQNKGMRLAWFRLFHKLAAWQLPSLPSTFLSREQWQQPRGGSEAHA